MQIEVSENSKRIIKEILFAFVKILITPIRTTVTVMVFSETRSNKSRKNHEPNHQQRENIRIPPDAHGLHNAVCGAHFAEYVI